MIALFLSLVFWLSISPSHAATTCEPANFDTQIETVFDDGQARYEVWQLADAATLWQQAPPTSHDYASYLSWITALVDTDPYRLLERQRAVFLRYSMHEEVKKFDLILKRVAGAVHPIWCVESLLFDAHLRRLPTVSLRAEFSAFILTREHELRIYVSMGLGQSPPPFNRINERIETDLTMGWVMRSMLHNHYFYLEQLSIPGADIAGTTIPSETDAATFLYFQKHFGLQEAWITNGISSLQLQANEFDRFK